MSVAASSAFAPSGAHPIGVSSIPDRPSLKAKLRNSPWTRLLPSVVAEMGYLKRSDGKPFTYMSSPEASAESESLWD